MKTARSTGTPTDISGVNTKIRVETGRRLAQIRGHRSQPEFAAELGVHKNTYGGYERGETEVGADAVRRLAEMGWNANWVLTGKGPEQLNVSASDSPVGHESQSLSEEALSIAIELANKIIGDRWLPAPHYASLVWAINEELTGGASYDEILHSGRSIADELFRGNRGGNESVVGGARKSGPGAVTPRKREAKRRSR